MFRPTDPQLSLMESRYLVSPKKQERLTRSWAHSFRMQVLPKIDEEAFRECFCADNGRPNTSIRLLVGMCLLKEADDLTVAQVLDAIEFNIQWQYALGVEPADAHISEKTVYNFLNRFAQNQRAQRAFEGLTQALVEADGLSVVRQRLDSTHLISNIRILTRLGLFTETVTNFLRVLRKDAPEKLAKLEDGYANRYLDREGYFADAKRDQARRRLPVVAQDLYALVRAFEADEDVNTWASYGLLVRLLSEQCDVVGGEGGETPPVQVKEPEAIGGDSLQSPHDPDATYGHKGKGYEAQLAETCVEGNPYQVITGVALTDANGSDQHATVPMVEQLDGRGCKPAVLLGDTGYGSGENIVSCALRGVDLVTPVQDPAAPPRADAWETPVEPLTVAPTEPPEPAPPPVAAEPAVEAPVEAPAVVPMASPEPATPSAMAEPAVALGLESFAFTESFDEVLRCPRGAAPIDQYRTDTGFYGRFPGTSCATCPFAERCPTRPRPDTDDRVLRWKPSKAATAARQKEQQAPSFRETYKLRSGIESTNAELKGRHGAGNLRVRRRPRVELALYLKAAALNAKRAVQHHTDVLRLALQGGGEMPPVTVG